MPRPVSWLPRLHEIRKRVGASVRSHYERKDIEKLFELKPRAAQILLETLPTIMVGRSRLVEREALAKFLERVRAADDVGGELEKIRGEKPGDSRRKIRTMVRRDLDPGSLNSLPQSVSLSRCRLEISFRTIEDLAQAMYGVARAIEAEGDEMARLYEVEREPVEDAGGDDVAGMFEELMRMEGRGGGKAGSNSLKV